MKIEEYGKFYFRDLLKWPYWPTGVAALPDILNVCVFESTQLKNVSVANGIMEISYAIKRCHFSENYVNLLMRYWKW